MQTALLTKLELDDSGMEIIGTQEIWTFLKGTSEIQSSSCDAIRKRAAPIVRNYMELATKIAALQFRNRDFVLMFRGQSADYRNLSHSTTLKPTLMRASKPARVPSVAKIERRFDILRAAEVELVREYKKMGFEGLQRLQRQQILRWSIIQHYRICETPLLDVTHSLRIAASFASEGKNEKAYVFVIGVPHISGAITASAEAGLQIVRLSSVCPPSAVRPHIQEGYLLGEYPDFVKVEQKQYYAHFEMDFGRRLIAKFQFHPVRFWENSSLFPQVCEDALYPDATQDPLCRLADRVKSMVS